MENKSTPEKDLASIRQMMERSAKFMSLSGMSGILAGGYALIGSATAYYVISHPATGDVTTLLVVIAAAVLIASLATGLWFSMRKSRRMGTAMWNPTSRNLFIDLAVPLGSGGLLILILLYRHIFTLIAPGCLLFYGIALFHGSAHSYRELRFLGASEIVLGLLAAALPGYGLVLWALGFGVLHIIYGAVMHVRYDQ